LSFDCSNRISNCRANLLARKDDSSAFISTFGDANSIPHIRTDFHSWSTDELSFYDSNICTDSIANTRTHLLARQSDTISYRIAYERSYSVAHSIAIIYCIKSYTKTLSSAYRSANIFSYS